MEASGMVAFCRERERRCISTLCVASLKRATCVNCWRSKSAPSSRLMRASRLRLKAGHTDWIIVGGDQCFFGLEHVDAEQKRVPGLENLTQITKKVRAGGAIEVAYGTAEEKHKKMLG